MKFGEYLISEKLVRPADLEDAIEIQRYLKKPIGRILKACGYIGERDLNLALEKFLDPPFVNRIADCYTVLQTRHFSNELLEFGETHELIPFEEEQNGVTFVTKTFRDEVLEEAGFVRQHGHWMARQPISAELVAIG